MVNTLLCRERRLYSNVTIHGMHNFVITLCLVSNAVCVIGQSRELNLHYAECGKLNYQFGSVIVSLLKRVRDD